MKIKFKAFLSLLLTLVICLSGFGSIVSFAEPATEIDTLIGLDLSTNDVMFDLGNSRQLNVYSVYESETETYRMDITGEQSLSYTSSNENVFSISGNTVTANSYGSAIVTVTYAINDATHTKNIMLFCQNLSAVTNQIKTDHSVVSVSGSTKSEAVADPMGAIYKYDDVEGEYTSSTPNVTYITGGSVGPFSNMNEFGTMWFYDDGVGTADPFYITLRPAVGKMQVSLMKEANVYRVQHYENTSYVNKAYTTRTAGWHQYSYIMDANYNYTVYLDGVELHSDTLGENKNLTSGVGMYIYGFDGTNNRTKYPYYQGWTTGSTYLDGNSYKVTKGSVIAPTTTLNGANTSGYTTVTNDNGKIIFTKKSGATVAWDALDVKFNTDANADTYLVKYKMKMNAQSETDANQFVILGGSISNLHLRNPNLNGSIQPFLWSFKNEVPTENSWAERGKLKDYINKEIEVSCEIQTKSAANKNSRLTWEIEGISQNVSFETVNAKDMDNLDSMRFNFGNGTIENDISFELYDFEVYSITRKTAELKVTGVTDGTDAVETANALKGKTATVNYEFKNVGLGNEQAYTVIVAVYDKVTGKLLNVNYADCTAIAQGTSASDTITLAVPNATNNIELFSYVWSSASGMKPLVNKSSVLQ